MILRLYSRSCRAASIRSGIAGGLAGKLRLSVFTLRDQQALHEVDSAHEQHAPLRHSQCPRAPGSIETTLLRRFASDGNNTSSRAWVGPIPPGLLAETYSVDARATADPSYR